MPAGSERLITAFLAMSRPMNSRVANSGWPCRGSCHLRSAAARAVVSAMPVKRLSYPRRLSMLPAVCDAVLADLVD